MFQTVSKAEASLILHAKEEAFCGVSYKNPSKYGNQDYP